MNQQTQPMRQRSEGFSLLEALIAMLLFVILVIGVLPLFSRAMIQNVAGRESTLATNHSKTRVEDMYQLPLDRDDLTVPAGSQEQRIDDEWCKSSGWEDTTAPANDNCDPDGNDYEDDAVLWTRTTTTQIYSIAEIYDATPTEFNTPMDGNTPPGFAHIWEVGAAIRGRREGLLAPMRGLDNTGQARPAMDLITLRGF